MKNILIALGLLVGTLASSEPAFTDVIAQTTSNPHPSYTNVSPPKTSSAETAVDDVITILLDQGFAGAIIIILFAWTFRVDKANRAEQKENTAKFEDLSKECSQHMASVSVKLENLEREVEQFKQLEILRKS